MGNNIHQLPCGKSEHEDYGCIDCRDYPCMLWKAARGEMRLPGEIGRGFIERTINEDRIFWLAGAHNLSVFVEGEVDFIALRKEEE